MKKAESSFSLLNTFRSTFDGQKYQHRNSILGDLIASQLYEDLLALGKSTLLSDRITRRERVVNAANKAVGKKSRRGDGTFGELVNLTQTEKEYSSLLLRVSREYDKRFSS